MEDGKVYHDISDAEAFGRVLIIHPKNVAEAFVYHPACYGEKPWTRCFASYDEAKNVAIPLAAKRGQSVIPVTRDNIEWWLRNDGYGEGDQEGTGDGGG